MATSRRWNRVTLLVTSLWEKSLIFGNEVKKLKKGDRVLKGGVDPSAVFAHHLPLTEAKHGFELFNQRKDQCIKIRLQP